MIDNNFVIFRHFHIRGYWELSGALYTTYLMDDLILNENKHGLETMLHLHNITNTRQLIEDLIRYTQDPQEDMFIVEI
jgi:hypothetical protein